VKDEVFSALKYIGCSQEGGQNVVYVTGHSYGSAITKLAMFGLVENGWRVAKSYDFEGPRVGNEAFARHFDSAFGRYLPTFRVTHNRDPVVHLPFDFQGFEHVQQEVFYAEDGSYTVCKNVEDKSCSNQFSDIVRSLVFHTNDHCNAPALLPNGDFCSPLGCDNKASTSKLEIIV